LASEDGVEFVTIGNFSEASLDGWEEKVFSGKTLYRLSWTGNKYALLSESQNSASGMFKKTRVDLRKYPYLNWSWKIENRLKTVDEKKKSGDDYAARVYVIVGGGALFWKAKALSYVWAKGSPVGDVWTNAFDDKNVMIMLAQRSGGDKTSTWYNEKRNVFKDLKRIFGTDFRYIDAVALMTDSDNSKGHVTTYYGDIYFSSK
jgi:Protein of unknown function (DUF3047)